jgi:hypothetical protein
MKWLLVAGAALVVAVVAIVVVVARRDDGPPPVASGSGVYRVHAQIRADGGQNAPEEVSYRGTTFRVQLTDVAGSGDDRTATLAVTGPKGTRKVEKARTGTTVTVDGAGLKVRTIYAGSRDSDDVVDVQVIPPSP